MAGMSELERRINELNETLEELRAERSEANSTLKQLQKTRAEIETLLSTDIRKMVEDRAEPIIKAELDKLGPQLREQSTKIYEKVGQEIDKLIDLALGKEFAESKGRSDLRPQLALHLRRWLNEIIQDEFKQIIGG